MVTLVAPSEGQLSNLAANLRIALTGDPNIRMQNAQLANMNANTSRTLSLLVPELQQMEAARALTEAQTAFSEATKNPEVARLQAAAAASNAQAGLYGAQTSGARLENDITRMKRDSIQNIGDVFSGYNTAVQNGNAAAALPDLVTGLFQAGSNADNIGDMARVFGAYGSTDDAFRGAVASGSDVTSAFAPNVARADHLLDRAEDLAIRKSKKAVANKNRTDPTKLRKIVGQALDIRTAKGNIIDKNIANTQDELAAIESRVASAAEQIIASNPDINMNTAIEMAIDQYVEKTPADPGSWAGLFGFGNFHNKPRELGLKPEPEITTDPDDGTKWQFMGGDRKDPKNWRQVQ